MATLIEGLRRIYHDMVVRRSTVRVLTPREVELEYPPIFIVGVYRSGTTLLRYVLDSHSRICCPPESYFITALFPLVNDKRSSGGLKSMGFDEEHVIRKIRELCLYFFGNYAASHGKPRWADKTPGYVDYLDFLLRVFPESQFIIVYRHGLDQAYSYTRGGTFMRDSLHGYCRDEDQDIRIGAVRYWCEKTQKLITFVERHPEKCIPVFYEKLCQFPQQQLGAIFDFIQEPWEPQVIRFYEFPHDVGREDGRTLATRGFLTSRDHYLDWPPKLVEQCMQIARPTMERLGYKVQMRSHNGKAI